MSDSEVSLSIKDLKQKPVSVGSIQVNPCQRGNPILKEIRNVPWEFVEGIAPDYILGREERYIYKLLKKLLNFQFNLSLLVRHFSIGPHCIALFLSLRYFTLQPNYIHDR